MIIVNFLKILTEDYFIVNVIVCIATANVFVHNFGLNDALFIFSGNITYG